MGLPARKKPTRSNQPPKHSFSDQLQPPTLEELAWIQTTSDKEFSRHHTKKQLPKYLANKASKQLPTSHVVVRNGTKLLGYHRLFPSTYEHMKAFLNKEITQEELIKDILDKELKFPTSTSIYLCEAFIQPQNHLQGLAIKSAKHALAQTKAPPHASLYAWPTSNAGLQAAKKLAQETNRSLYLRR